MLNKRLNNTWIKNLTGDPKMEGSKCSQKLHSVWKKQLLEKRKSLVQGLVETSGLRARMQIRSKEV